MYVVFVCAEVDDLGAGDFEEEDVEGPAPKKIGFIEPEKEEGENWIQDPMRWHPALGIKVLPAVPATVGARIGIDGNMEILQV